jgi:hypothetical protein
MPKYMGTAVAFITAFLGLMPVPLFAGDSDLLLHWKGDEGGGAVTKDYSKNGLDGAVKARWLSQGAIQAFGFDGTATSTVSVQLPPDQRFGTESWSLMAWINPTQLSIVDKQNQRRLFAYGKYPDACLVMDLFSAGTLGYYFCYTNGAGAIESVGDNTSIRIKTNEWTHIALVCNRSAKYVHLYINGQSQSENSLPPAFTGDFSLGGGLSLGSSWHNYCGLMDEIKIYRRALSRNEVRKEFKTMHDVYGVTESAEFLATDTRETIQVLFQAANAAWKTKHYDQARAEYANVLNLPQAPEHYKSYAHLRIAQSYRAEKNTAAAKREYEKISAQAAYPAVHRDEALECVNEIDRAAQGLPPRDPLASRVKIQPIPTFAASVYVAPDGCDTNDGSRQKPFATLTQARDAVRKIKARGVTGAIGVVIKPGEYPITNTLSLTAEDSGTAQSPIVYRAEKKGTATLYGGIRLTGFQPVTDSNLLDRLPAESRGKVMQCDLRALGITDTGHHQVRGFGQPPSPPTLELFFNGHPMTLARWPNTGFVQIKKLIAAGDKGKGIPSVIQYDSERPARWTKARDLWLFGYFKYLWADATIKIAAIDPQAQTLTTAEAYQYGQGAGMDTQQGIIYYAFNLLEELDAPGEWFLDRESGLLFFYPPSDLAKATVEIGRLSKPMLTLENVTNVRIEGLQFDLGRFNGIRIAHSQHCRVDACTVKRFAGNGITIEGGHENGILGCDIHTIGRSATEVIGGDRKTLTPGKHFVENCQIHSFGRIDRTYTPGIQLDGVGHRVAHNLLYDCPSSALRIEGNDHVMEFNQVFDAVQESDDQGAMELYGNPTYRGVIFRYNYFDRIGKTGTEVGVHGQAGIRFDDAISGMLVYGNIFRRSAQGHFGGVQMNCGRDNILDNNIFAECRQAVSGGWNSQNSIWKMLREGKKPAGFYLDELYGSRYPAIRTMMDEPGMNQVWRNIFYHCDRLVTGNLTHIDMLENGIYADDDPGFRNAARGDFRLKPDAPLFHTVGFRPIPIDEIGLYDDPYRASWPVKGILDRQ